MLKGEALDQICRARYTDTLLMLSSTLDMRSKFPHVVLQQIRGDSSC